MLMLTMARLLAELLGASEPGFSLMIRRLEQDAGLPSVDVRMAAEISSLGKLKLQELGLDAEDTNGEELYHSLLELVKTHDQSLKSAMKATKSDNFEDAILLIKSSLKKLDAPQACWALKPSTAKRLLQVIPPKNVMKHLGYRSIDSMLKRERISELFAAVLFMESNSWHSRYLLKCKTLKSTDFENREIEILAISAKKWGEPTVNYVNIERNNLICIRLMGAIAILPLPLRRLQGFYITVLPQIINCFHQIRVFSVYCKLQQVKPNFGSLVSEATNGRLNSIINLADSPLPWIVLQRHFGAPDSNRLELFEPHIQSEELDWKSVSELMVQLDPELKFWHSSNYLGAAYPDGVVSYNLLDASLNYCNNIPYHKQIVRNMREALRHELIARYLVQAPIERSVFKQMENYLTK